MAFKVAEAMVVSSLSAWKSTKAPGWKLFPRPTWPDDYWDKATIIGKGTTRYACNFTKAWNTASACVDQCATLNSGYKALHDFWWRWRHAQPPTNKQPDSKVMNEPIYQPGNLWMQAHVSWRCPDVFIIFGIRHLGYKSSPLIVITHWQSHILVALFSGQWVYRCSA